VLYAIPVGRFSNGMVSIISSANAVPNPTNGMDKVEKIIIMKSHTCSRDTILDDSPPGYWVFEPLYLPNSNYKLVG